MVCNVLMRSHSNIFCFSQASQCTHTRLRSFNFTKKLVAQKWWLTFNASCTSYPPHTLCTHQNNDKKSMAFNLPFPTIIWKPVVPMKSLYGPVTDVSSKHRDGAPKTMRFLLDRSILVYTNVYDRRRVETEPMLTKWRPRGGRNRGGGWW